MHFFSFFKTLVGKRVVVELKNDISIAGTLQSVDAFSNLQLVNIKVTEEDKYPHLIAVDSCFIRGNVIRYIQLPPEFVDTQLLQDAARRAHRT